MGSGRVVSYGMVEISFESRTSANRYARVYDAGGIRSMVKQCNSDYCADGRQSYIRTGNDGHQSPVVTLFPRQSAGEGPVCVRTGNIVEP